MSVYLDETFNRGTYSSGLSEAFQYIAKIFQKYGLPNPAVVNGSIMQFDATEKNLVSNLGKASIEINNDSSLKFYVVMYFSISPDSLNTLTDSISGAIEQLLDIKTNLPLPMVDELKAMQPEEPEVPPTKPPFVDDSDYGGGYIGDSDYEVTPAPTEICTQEAGFIVIDWTGERLEYTDGCQKKLIIDMLNNDNISYHYEGYEEVSNPEIVAPPAPESPLETNPPILRARSPQENPVAVEEVALVEPQISRRRSPQANPSIVEEIAFVEPTIPRRRSLAS